MQSNLTLLILDAHSQPSPPVPAPMLSHFALRCQVSRVCAHPHPATTSVKLVPLPKALSPRSPTRSKPAPLTRILSLSGYNQIFIIPAGATSIRIEEAAASRNFLGERWFGTGQAGAQRWLAVPRPLTSGVSTAVKSVHGEYYLNGHWTIEAAQALPVASTVLQYERGVEGDLAPERLQARGPTSEPLIIEVSEAPREVNPARVGCSGFHGPRQRGT